MEDPPLHPSRRAARLEPPAHDRGTNIPQSIARRPGHSGPGRSGSGQAGPGGWRAHRGVQFAAGRPTNRTLISSVDRSASESTASHQPCRSNT